MARGFIGALENGEENYLWRSALRGTGRLCIVTSIAICWLPTSASQEVHQDTLSHSQETQNPANNYLCQTG